MEIVCRPETYRRFKSSSLRQKKTEYFDILSLFIFDRLARKRGGGISFFRTDFTSVFSYDFMAFRNESPYPKYIVLLKVISYKTV